MGLEQWDDRGLTKLNRQIWTVAGQHEGCCRFGEFGVSAGVAKENIAKLREYIEASKPQCRAPGRLAREASNAYRDMR
jgi:hypothetical protein